MQGSVIGGGLLSSDGLEEEIANTTGFERAGRLEVFELEEDPAGSR